MSKRKGLVVGAIVVLCVIVVAVILVVVASAKKQSEEKEEYKDVTNEYVEDNQKYICRETELLKVIYPCTTNSVEYEADKIEVSPYVGYTNEIMVGGKSKNERYVYRKVMLLKDIFSDDEDVKQVDYRLYDCRGRLSKKASDTTAINPSDFLPEVGADKEVYESKVVTMLYGEYSSKIESKVLMPFNIQVIDDVAIEQCKSDADVNRLVKEQLEKAVVKAVIYYNDGRVEEKYYKLDCSNV